MITSVKLELPIFQFFQKYQCHNINKYSIDNNQVEYENYDVRAQKGLGAFSV